MRVAITTENNQQIFNEVLLKSQVEKVTVDLTNWCEDNGDVVTAEWSTITGNVSVSNDSDSANVLTAYLNADDAGNSLIRCKVTTSEAVYVVLICVLVRDPNVSTGDYKIV